LAAVQNVNFPFSSCYSPDTALTCSASPAHFNT